MNYFCAVHLQSKKDEEKRIFVVLESNSNEKLPNLTKEILIENNQYKDYILKYKPKIVLVEYKVYSTDKEIFASSQDEVFEELINNSEANFIGESEINIDCAKDKTSYKRHKKKKSSLFLKTVITGGVFIMIFVAFLSGNALGKKSNIETDTQQTNAIINEDGMIMKKEGFSR